MSIQQIGVVGAGTMGNGIAQVCALKGDAVVMTDISQHALDRGLATVGSSLDRLIKKHTISAAVKDAALARITTSTRWRENITRMASKLAEGEPFTYGESFKRQVLT